MRNISFILTICTLLIISVAGFSFALSGISYINQDDDNTCYVFSENNPDVKFYINDINRFVRDIVNATIHRNDYDELTLIGDLVHIDGMYTHKYEVLAGNGEVHIYLYKLLDNDFGDDLYITLSMEQINNIEQAINNSRTKSGEMSSSNSITTNLPNVQSVSTYSQILNNADANDAYSTMAGLSRITPNDSTKKVMLLYHPVLNIRDILDSGVNLHNITDFYSNILYILNNE